MSAMVPRAAPKRISLEVRVGPVADGFDISNAAHLVHRITSISGNHTYRAGLYCQSSMSPMGPYFASSSLILLPPFAKGMTQSGVATSAELRSVV
jgi:hypothetical protein